MRGDATYKMIQTLSEQLYELAAKRIKAGHRVEDLVGILHAQDGEVAVFLGTKAEAIEQLRTAIAPSPKSTIRGLENENSSPGCLRVVTMIAPDGWGTHDIAIPTPGGQA